MTRFMDLATYTLWLLEDYDFLYLKKHKIPLEDDERQKAMDAGCVWHFSHLKKPSCAIWKAKSRSGKTVYCCHTHRACAIKDTLAQAIKAFDFIKTTA